MNVVSEPGPRSPRMITLEEPRRTVLHNCFHTLCSTPPPPWLVKWHLCVKFGSFPVSNNTQHGVWYSEMLALKVCGRDTVINLKLRPWLVPPNEQQPSPTEQNISKRRPFSIHRTSVEEPGLKCLRCLFKCSLLMSKWDQRETSCGLKLEDLTLDSLQQKFHYRFIISFWITTSIC